MYFQIDGCAANCIIELEDVDVQSGSSNPMHAIVENGAKSILTTDKFRIDANMHYPREFNAVHVWKYKMMLKRSNT